jgi:hypothetical protein
VCVCVYVCVCEFAKPFLEYGRADARQMIFDHLQAVERNNFHLTLAVFWIQMAHLSLLRVGVDVSHPVDEGKRTTALSLVVSRGG